MILLFQLYIEYYHLNQYLYQFNIIKTLKCEYDKEKEIIKYYLLNYELYNEKRNILRRRIEVQEMRSSILLKNNQMIQNIMNYIKKMNYFKLEQR